MRRAVLIVALLLVVASSASAAPFLPDLGTVTALDAIFVSTGTNTLCLNCSDSDPANDLLATLTMAPLGGLVAGILTSWGGALTTITTRTEAPNFSEPFQIHARISLSSLHDPAYPLPSVTDTTLVGTFLGFHGPFDDGLNVNCCVGGTSSVSFLAGGAFPYALYPITQATQTFQIDTFLTRQPVEYTPVPESSSLLLLGTGLLTAWRVRSRRGVAPSRSRIR